MAPKSASLILQQRIEQELARLDGRATELRIALKVVTEFSADPVVEESTNGAEVSRIILKPSDDVPDAIRSRMADRPGAASKVADQTLDLERT